jgi:purine nucleosidase
MNWVIDTDAGVDDAIAFSMPFASGNRYPDFKLIAATTVAGNCSLDKVNVNVGAVLDALGQPTPMISGCALPLIEPYQDAADFHGVDGLGDVGLSVTERKPTGEHGALALVRLARENAGNFGLLALGPLTNVALACNLDPDFPKNVSRLVVMGGAWRGQGNQSSASEFNIAVDPESAAVVLARFAHSTWVPWEVSLDAMYPYERFAELDRAKTKRAAFYKPMMQVTSDTLRKRFSLPGMPMPDPLAMAVTLDPGTVKRVIRTRLKVDVAHGAGRALTTLDMRHPTPNVDMVVDMHFERAFDMIAAGLSGV